MTDEMLMPGRSCAAGVVDKFGMLVAPDTRHVINKLPRSV